MLGRRLLFVIALLWAPSAWAAEGGISVEGADHCPGRAQIESALEARLPGVTGPGATRLLELQREPDALTLRLREGGAVALERRLPVDPRAASDEACAALAEAAAQVVVRYLREIGYRPPVSAAPTVVEVLPRVPTTSMALPEVYGLSAGYLAVGVGLRASSTTRGEVAASFQLHRTGWLAGWVGALSAGASTERTATVIGVPGAALRLRSFPIHLSLGLALEVGPGALVPTLGAGADLLSFRASGLDDARSGLRVEPAAEAGVSYLWSGTRLFARGGVTGGLTLHAHDFDADVTQPVFRTPGAYLRAQIELGLVLWKNRRRLGL